MLDHDVSIKKNKQIFKKNQIPVKVISRNAFESPDLGQFSILSVYLSLYVRFRESGLNVPSKLSTSWQTGKLTITFCSP